jgi:NAD-dependent DNA ligase
MQIKIPTECPCCNYKLQFVKDQLFCRNTACDAQINKKLEHFAKVLSIKGLGPKTVEKLGLSDLTELFYLDKDEVTAALGSVKLTEKLLEEVEKAKSADLATVIASMSIPLIGETASNKIADVVSDISEITQETCKEAGLGEKATINLLNWLNTEFLELKDFLPFSFKSSKKILVNATGKTVCITGKLVSYKTKSEATAVLEEAGFRVVDSVTKITNYLIDEGDKGSTKRKKAEELGIPIINNIQIFLKEQT